MTKITIQIHSDVISEVMKLGPVTPKLWRAEYDKQIIKLGYTPAYFKRVISKLYREPDFNQKKPSTCI